MERPGSPVVDGGDDLGDGYARVEVVDRLDFLLPPRHALPIVGFLAGLVAADVAARIECGEVEVGEAGEAEGRGRREEVSLGLGESS